MISKINTASAVLLAWILWVCSFCTLRSSRVWVFTGWHTGSDREIFADNSKYLFLYVANNIPEIDSIWIAKDKKLARILTEKGYRSYCVHSLQGIYYSLRAKYTFVDALIPLPHWKFSGRSSIIQLWHGKGMKRSGNNSNYKSTQNKITQPNLTASYEKIVASSLYTAEMMTKTFATTLDKVLISGLPRNDVLLDTIPGAHIDAHPQLEKIVSARKKNTRFILYTPTFRADGSNPIEKLDLVMLRRYIEEKGDHFIISLHPKFARKAWSGWSNSKNIHFIDAGYDIYPHLKDIDILITDYSSLYVDFLLLDRPIIFFTYDLEQYKKESGLYEDFKEMTPGTHVTSTKKIIEALRRPDNFSSERNKVRNMLFKHIDAYASKRIIDTLL